jgi:hypothetical protein
LVKLDAAIAKEAGFSISADDLTKAQSELSAEELEGVAGGAAGELTEVVGIPGRRSWQTYGGRCC